MPDMLGSLGSFFGGSGSAGKGLLDLLGIGTAGAGILGNIQNEQTRSGQIGQIKQAEKTLGNPQQLAAQVASATQPLSQGLVQSVGNTVGASEAERGLSQAPGIQATELAQALAPFQQANQNTALQLVMERLGLPMQFAQTIFGGLPQNTNISPILAMLMKQSMGGGGTNPSFAGAPANVPAGNDIGTILSNINNPQTAGTPTITDSPIDLSFLGEAA